MSSWPSGQAAGSADALIGRVSTNVDPQARHRNSYWGTTSVWHLQWVSCGSSELPITARRPLKTTSERLVQDDSRRGDGAQIPVVDTARVHQSSELRERLGPIGAAGRVRRGDARRALDDDWAFDDLHSGASRVGGALLLPCAVGGQGVRVPSAPSVFAGLWPPARSSRIGLVAIAIGASRGSAAPRLRPRWTAAKIKPCGWVGRRAARVRPRGSSGLIVARTSRPRVPAQARCHPTLRRAGRQPVREAESVRAWI